MENSVEVTKKFNNRASIWSNSTFFRFYAEELKLGSQRDISIPILIVPLVIVAKMQKQCPLTHEWIKKMWYIKVSYTGMIFTPKKKEIMSYETPWINFEDSTLNEIS